MVSGDEVLAARHFLGGTDEFDFHRHEIVIFNFVKFGFKDR
jgi:hypothetical protein